MLLVTAFFMLARPYLLALGLFGWPKPCAFEKFSDSPHLRVSQSDWVIDTWGQACGFGVSGGMEIRAVNEKTQEMDTVAQLPDILTVGMSSDEPNQLAITLPNLVVISSSKTQIGDVHIVYRFSPKDDPDARLNYQKWRRDPGNNQARAWYCQNILAKMDASNRARWNEIIGQSYPAPNSAERKYCP